MPEPESRIVNSLLDDASHHLAAEGIASVRQLFSDVDAALAADVPRLLSKANAWLRAYDGIPTSVNIFDILGLSHREDPHTNFLAWLLDPQGSHAIGDAFLRRFLGLLPISALSDLVANVDALQAWSHTQFSFPSHGRPDLVLIVPDSPRHAHAIIVEAKIGARLTVTAEGPQTQRYAAALSGPDAIETNLLAPVRQMHSVSLQMATPHFVFLRAKHTASPALAVDASPDELPPWHILEYAAVERSLSQLACRHDMSPNVRSLLQQYRTSLLNGALDTPASLDTIRKLRRLTETQGSVPLGELGRDLSTALGDILYHE